MDDDTTASDETSGHTEAETEGEKADDRYDLETPGLTLDELVAVLI